MVSSEQIVALTEAVAAVCPISGVYIGQEDDRSTWGAHFAAEATDDQRTAASNVLATFDLAAVPIPAIVPSLAFLARLTDAEYGAILSAAAQNVQLARWIDILRLSGTIDVADATAQTAKAALVAAGLLTADRANLIFAP